MRNDREYFYLNRSDNSLIGEIQEIPKSDTLEYFLRKSIKISETDFLGEVKFHVVSQRKKDSKQGQTDD